MKKIIQILRKLTDISIVIGGFAFSFMSEQLMKYLQPDFGIIGGPDAFFEHFEDVLIQQNLDQIANLIYYEAMRFFYGAPLDNQSNRNKNKKRANQKNDNQRLFPIKKIRQKIR